MGVFLRMTGFFELTSTPELSQQFSSFVLTSSLPMLKPSTSLATNSSKQVSFVTGPPPFNPTGSPVLLSGAAFMRSSSETSLINTKSPSSKSTGAG